LITFIAFLCTLAGTVLGKVFPKIIAARPMAAGDGGMMNYAMDLIIETGTVGAKAGVLCRSKLIKEPMQPMHLVARKQVEGWRQEFRGQA
jgi:hypothetical protein